MAAPKKTIKRKSSLKRIDKGQLHVHASFNNTIITITCTGDLTIGGDNYHKKGKKFYEELRKKNGDNINFTMANVRDIFKDDTLTLVNFEGTFTETTYVPDKKKGNDFLVNN